MTYARCGIALVHVLGRYIVVKVIVVLSSGYALSKVQETTVRAVRCGRQIVRQIWEAGRGAAPMSRETVMLIVTITAWPGLGRTASASGFSLGAVTIHAGHIVTWKQVPRPFYLSQCRNR